MHSLSLIRQLDRHWLAALGLLGACGPLPPGENLTDATSGGMTTDETTSMTAPTSTTTGPPPECVESWDCGPCSTCDNGVCQFYYGCCEYDYSTPGGGWRCSPPEYNCTDDEECPAGYICEDWYCVPDPDPPPPPPPPLPSCPPGQADVSQWDLTQSPGSLGLADLDGDGDLDLFAALPAVAAIELAFNDGAGVFTPGGLIDVGPPGTMRVAAGDLDGDGDVDLAVAREDGSDLILLFGQDGMFMPGPILPASVPPRTITAADLDGDGDSDLVTFSGDLGVVSAWLGDGVGGFAAEKILIEFVDSKASSLQHVDSDSAADLLTLPAPGTSPVMTLYRGTPEAVLAFPQLFELDAAAWTQALAGDLAGSPARELVAMHGDGGGGVVRVWGGIDDATWANPLDAATASPLVGGVLADTNGDAFLDLVAASGGPIFSVLLGDGQGGFSCEQFVDVGAITSPEVLAAGDVDGNGSAELVVGSHDLAGVRVIRTL